MVTRIIARTSFLFIPIYGALFFLPYGEIKKSGDTSIELQIWWYYGNVAKNMDVISLHVFISLLGAFILSYLIQIFRSKK